MNKVFKVLLFFLISCDAFASYAIAEQCGSIFYSETVLAKVVKTRNSGARIFALSDGRFFKEETPARDYQDRIFNEDYAGVLAYKLFKTFKVERYLAKSYIEDHGMELSIDGKITRTNPGIVQEGRNDLVNPILDFKRQFGSSVSRSYDLHYLLNQKDWPRHYANWKLIWMLLRQVDLSIENLAVSEGTVFVFDTGDAFNKSSDRCRFGVCNTRQGFDYNFPGRPSDRVQHVPDFRRADKDLKNMVRELSSMSVAQLIELLGQDFYENLKSLRGSPEETLREIRNAARKLLPLFDKPPEF
ncbi:MAG: hypothetical protein ACXVCY_08815 [Pseudobdellovibrionaceae bacterium]